MSGRRIVFTVSKKSSETSILHPALLIHSLNRIIYQEEKDFWIEGLTEKWRGHPYKRS